MAGLYPIMMFALPAIALAIIHEAREDLKPKVRATFLTAAFACFFNRCDGADRVRLFIRGAVSFYCACHSLRFCDVDCICSGHPPRVLLRGRRDRLFNQPAPGEKRLAPHPDRSGIRNGLLRLVSLGDTPIPHPYTRPRGRLAAGRVGRDIPYRSPLILQALGERTTSRTLKPALPAFV